MPNWNFQRLQAVGLSSRMAELLLLGGRDSTISRVEAAATTTIGGGDPRRVLVDDKGEGDVLARQDPRCRLHHAGARVLANGNNTLPFDSERYDNRGMHDNATNNHLITMARAGVYHVGANVSFGASATGQRQLLIYHRTAGGTNTIIGIATCDAVGGSQNTYLNASVDYFFDAGESAWFQAYQNTGGNLTSPGPVNSYAPWEAWAHYLGLSILN